jgi:protein involved in polysaccharide export with SLBB domain
VTTASILRSLVGAALLGVVLSAGASRAAAQAPADTGVLAPGDLVRVTVFRKPELSGDIEVGADGTLLHPLYRSVQVTGVPEAEVERRLAAVISHYEEQPAFIVEPLVRVAVGGEVRQPGVLTVRPSTSAFQALAQAGGPSERGRTDRVLLYRSNEVRVIPLAGNPAAAQSFPLRSGDALVVERRSTLRDILVPLASATAAAAALINLLSR